MTFKTGDMLKVKQTCSQTKFRGAVGIVEADDGAVMLKLLTSIMPYTHIWVCIEDLEHVTPLEREIYT